MYLSNSAQQEQDKMYIGLTAVRKIKQNPGVIASHLNGKKVFIDWMTL